MRVALCLCLLALMSLALVEAQNKKKPPMKKLRKFITKLWRECNNGEEKAEPLHSYCEEAMAAKKLELTTAPLETISIFDYIDKMNGLIAFSGIRITWLDQLPSTSLPSTSERPSLSFLPNFLSNEFSRGTAEEEEGVEEEKK